MVQRALLLFTMKTAAKFVDSSPCCLITLIARSHCKCPCCLAFQSGVSIGRAQSRRRWTTRQATQPDLAYIITQQLVSLDPCGHMWSCLISMQEYAVILLRVNEIRLSSDGAVVSKTSISEFVYGNFGWDKIEASCQWAIIFIALHSHMPRGKTKLCLVSHFCCCRFYGGGNSDVLHIVPLLTLTDHIICCSLSRITLLNELSLSSFFNCCKSLTVSYQVLIGRSHSMLFSVCNILYCFTPSSVFFFHFVCL
jgi:hypothetical protein